jgi:excinuclease ABC subunit B
MRVAIEQSNRRREKQIQYNIDHGLLPQQAKKSGTGQSLLLTQQGKGDTANAPLYATEERDYPIAADINKEYSTRQAIDAKNIDSLITKAREDMERAAKALDFLAAAKYRDRMYELQKLKEEL